MMDNKMSDQCTSNHGIYADTCDKFTCDICGGPLCQQTSRRFNGGTGINGFGCTNCQEAGYISEDDDPRGDWFTTDKFFS